jgi:RHS repeat-associated protein
MTNHLNQTTTFKYNTCTANLASLTDPNSQTISFAYDGMGRLTQKNLPDGGQTNNSIDDTARTVTSTTKVTTSPVLNILGTAYFDGLGRGHASVLNSDPDGATYSRTDYDAVGRTSKTWNPSRCNLNVEPPPGSCAGEATFGLTENRFDGMSRVMKVIPTDGTVSTNNIVTTYSGNCVTVADQAGKSRKSCSDALGRLIQVFEDPAGLNYETDYAYDTLDNLTQVQQKGGDANSANWRTRTFVYNSLSQLTSANNPESGTISYSYDADGNLLTKTAPAPNQTGSATVTTTFAYDGIHRLTQKSFSDSTPLVKYGYDAVAPSGCTLPTLTITNGIGRRTSMCDAAGAEAWSYDVMGRVTAERRTTNGVSKTTSYAYNLDGSAASIAYPSGTTITYSPGGAGRPLSATDSGHSINYALAAHYAPQGALNSFANGANLVSTFYYSSRLQPCRISVKSTGSIPSNCTDTGNIGNVLDFTYNFSVGVSDNGNVTGITNNRDTTRSQTFGYDPLNRLLTAETTSTSATSPSHCWGEKFIYDNQSAGTGPWGNLTNINVSQSSYNGCTQENLSVTATTKNQLAEYCFDAAGNLILNATCPAPPFTPTYNYNAENQLTSTAGVTYTYDGDGKRVQKSNGKLYWYGMGSDPMVETDASGNNPVEYIFFGGKRIARRDSAGAVSYYFADHLGTSRIVSNATGTVQDDSDFYPFGMERPYLSSSGNNYKFTGQERDSESGLDNFKARFDSSSLGRFMSPDPLGWLVWHRRSDSQERQFEAYISDPKNLNLYTYARNNPLVYIDPTGLYTCNGTEEQCADVERALDKAREALSTGKLSPKKRKDLQEVVEFYGAAGDSSDGVVVQFGKVEKGATADTDSSRDGTMYITTITIDPKKLPGLTLGQLTETVVHEGTHGLDGVARGGRNPETQAEEMATERRAYRTQSYVAEGVGGRASNGLWDPTWPADKAEASRDRAVEQSARRSTEIWCRVGGKCK